MHGADELKRRDGHVKECCRACHWARRSRCWWFFLEFDAAFLANCHFFQSFHLSSQPCEFGCLFVVPADHEERWPKDDHADGGRYSILCCFLVLNSSCFFAHADTATAAMAAANRRLNIAWLPSRAEAESLVAGDRRVDLHQLRTKYVILPTCQESLESESRRPAFATG